MAASRHAADKQATAANDGGLLGEVAATIDPMGIITPMLGAQLAWANHPRELAANLAALSTELAALQWCTWRRMAGLPSEDVVAPNPDDARFADPAWTSNAASDVLKEWYLAFTRHIEDMLYAAPGLAAKDQRRAAFWWRQLLNAMAPSNFLWTNPVALHKAIESRGDSLIRGFRIFQKDLIAGDIQLTSPESFRVGTNLATTPGSVVFRNRMLEVIHYQPTQPKQWKVPVVIVTPWINKFYVLDLNPKKSMIRFLLDQGFDVFVTSWRNPTPDMRDVRFDDYVEEGVARIVEVAQSLSGSSAVHTVGYCIGGAALTTYLAWANRRFAPAKVPVKTATLLATLIDYEQPGDVEVFLDENSYRHLAQAMQRKGFLDGKEMAAAFRLLRSNGLIWHYVVHGYLYGEEPPPFDVLYWNMDTTRMPAAMHTWYLREFYLDNNLVKQDALEVAGEKIDLERIVQPMYVASAADDHIAPWLQTFKVNAHVAGPKRFVLSSSGHILGIVNPPVSPPKREFWVGPAERHDTAESWRSRAEHRPGSWWEDWMDWLRPQSGKLVETRNVANAEYPVVTAAPGDYVLEP